jgi:colanic acid/amylovoran biosynthesis glycosyltransferase
MRIAYLVTAYPEVSHTFIRREILELERLGHSVLRLSIRRPTSHLVDALDLSEYDKTHYLLARPAALALATARALLLNPLRFGRALAKTLALARRSARGLVRHFAYLAEACLVRDLLRRERCEHLHVHFGTNAAAVGLLSHALGGPPWSFTAHGPDEFDAPLSLSLADKVADAAFTVAISHFAAAQLRRWSRPEDWERIAIVHCTIGAEFEKPAGPIPSSSRAFVSVGRLSAQKGQLLLIDAFAELIASGADARLVLAGDGELRAAVQKRIDERGLAQHVSIAGWVTSDQIRALLGASRALVLPSFAEGLPVVIMEAFALGRPVITTFVAGIPELVEAGKSGWLVPAGTIEPLVAALREALDAPIETLEAMGAAGRLQVLARHSTAREVQVLLEQIARSAGRTGT